MNCKLKKRAGFFIGLFVLLAWLTNTAVNAATPNVLLVCVDDLKPTIGCYGDKLAHTPNLDRLAARGVQFNAAYCNQAVCSPSRNALLVGLRPQTLGIYDLGTNFRKAVPDAVTLPQFFKQQGYRTEALGKIFHVGHGNHEDERSWSIEPWKANSIAYALPESKAPAGLTREEARFANKSPANLPRGAAFESADVPDDQYPDGAIAAEACRRLQQRAAKPDEPFFLAVGFLKPHLPFCAPQKYWKLYDASKFQLPSMRKPPQGAPKYAPQFGGELRQYRDIPKEGALPDDLQRQLIHGYYAAVSYMDAQLGRVLDELDKTGLAKNTIVVLWGDHGWHLGDHGMWCKHTNYEQAARIPLIVAGPGIEVGKQTAALVETVDIYPTLVELAEQKLPKPLDGNSFDTVLRDAAKPARDHVIHVYPRGELVGRALRTDRYRLVEWKKPGADAETAELELYDYHTEPLETKNLAEKQPEIVTELRSLLAKHPEAKPGIAQPAAKRQAAGKPKQ